MILLGLGSNLESCFGNSSATIETAFASLDRAPLKLIARSRLWLTEPVPVSDQPWFVNAVAEIKTRLSPEQLLQHLHEIEFHFGRVRHEVNAARCLDLDIIDYGGIVSVPNGVAPVLPHPRLAARAFVLKPMMDIVPGWQHPVTREPLPDLIAKLPPGQIARPANA